MKIESKFLNKYSNKYNWLIALLLGMLSMYMMLSYAGYLSTGKYCIVMGDNAEIYIPTILSLVRDIRNHQSIFYSWTNSFGMNTSLLNAFYGLNPFNVIFLLLPKVDPAIHVAFLIVFKTGLAACFFQLFSKKVLKIDGLFSVAFAVLYSMNSYQVDFNSINIIWLDAVFMLPLICTLLYEVTQSGKWGILPFAYTYLFISQFYMGYIVGIFSLLSFIIFIIFFDRKRKVFECIYKFIISGVIGVFISGIVWVPVVFFLKNNSASDATSFLSLQLNVLDLFSQLFFGQNAGVGGLVPDIYCGIISVMLLPLFFVSKKISLKNKISFGILLGVMSISCFVPFLYVMWHGFDVPDGWPFRFSFIISFVVCIMATMAFQIIEKKYLLLIGIYSFVAFALYCLTTLWQSFRFDTEQYHVILFMIINLIILIIWFGFIYFYINSKTEQKTSLAVVLIVLCCAELVGNGVCVFHKGGTFNFKEDHYKTWKNSEQKLIEFLDSDKGFYRVSYYNDIISNSDTWYGYNGISDFASSENPDLRNMLQKLGVYTSTRVTRNFGTSSFTDMLLGVKYTVYGVNPYAFFREEDEPSIIENSTLSIGYMVNNDILKCELLSNNAFENNNVLASALTGENQNLYVEVPQKNIKILEDGIHLSTYEDNYVVLEDSGNEFDYIAFYLDENIKKDFDYYFYIDNVQSILFEGAMVFEGGYENAYTTEGFTSVSYLKEFSDSVDDQKFVEIYAGDIHKQVMNGYYAAYLDKSVLQEIYNILSKEQFEVVSFKDGYLKGKINSNSDNNILFTSVPYDVGWSAYVDGNEVDIIPLLNGAVIGLELEKGEHDIELQYTVPGVKIGLIFSGFGLIFYMLVLIVLLLKKYKFIKI